MIHWVFAAVTLVAAGVAAFAKSFRLVVLALWGAGLGAGAMYITVGAELLAIVQWIVSTLIAVSFVFFSVMFGEYATTRERPALRGGIFLGFALLAMLALPGAIWLGGIGSLDGISMRPAAGEPGTNDVASLGTLLVQEHFLSLQILALTLFIALIGAGVVARPRQVGVEEEGGE